MVNLAYVIAGSEATGGAGLQVDLKTFQELGVYGVGTITCIVSFDPKNDWGHRFVPVPPEVIADQIEAATSAHTLDVVKIGMLGTPATIDVVAEGLRSQPWRHVVLDPVLICKGQEPGAALDTDNALREAILPLATVVTPNLFETKTLSGMDTIETVDDLAEAARRIHDLGPRYVLAKGGVELPGEDAVDVLFDGEDVTVLRGPQGRPGARLGRRVHPRRGGHRRAGQGRRRARRRRPGQALRHRGDRGPGRGPHPLRHRLAGGLRRLTPQPRRAREGVRRGESPARRRPGAGGDASPTPVAPAWRRGGRDDAAPGDPAPAPCRDALSRGARSGPPRRRIPLVRDALVLGNAPTCDVCLEDPDLSPQHAAVRRVGGTVVVEDLGSRLGTFLDGVAVTAPSELHAGDVLTLGDVRLRYGEAPPPSRPRRPRPTRSRRSTPPPRRSPWSPRSTPSWWCTAASSSSTARRSGCAGPAGCSGPARW